MGLAGEMRNHDAVIFGAIGEVLVFGTNQIPGILNDEFRELSFADGGVVGLAISFDCQWHSSLEQLARNDQVQVCDRGDDGTLTVLGEYRFQRIVNRDESGLTVLELGRIR